MKKFSESKTDDKKYAGSQVLKNRINDIITETLLVKVDGLVDENVSICGIDELVEKLHTFVTSNVMKSGIDEIKKIKNNPIL